MKKRTKFILLITVIVAFCVMLTACNFGVSVIEGDYSIEEDYKIEDTKTKINTMRTSDGISLKYEIEASSTDNQETASDKQTVSYASKNDIYYINATEEGEHYFDLTSDEYEDYYEKIDDVWTIKRYYYNEEFTKKEAQEEVDSLSNIILVYSFYYGGEAKDEVSGVKMKKEDATIINRSCDKYSWGVSVNNALISAGATTDCYIDKETGICLKWALSAGASAFGESGNGGISFTCKEFKTSFT
ncbi:MAG: hypothetical protein K5765_00120, partial [Clostridia bacterium]|nr:hypothetical protein [Clostridia bacterium]